MKTLSCVICVFNLTLYVVQYGKFWNDLNEENDRTYWCRVTWKRMCTCWY